MPATSPGLSAPVSHSRAAMTATRRVHQALARMAGRTGQGDRRGPPQR